MRTPTFEELREQLKAFTKAPVIIHPAVVKMVNLDEYSIDVEPIGGAEIFDVRLKAGIDEIKDGIVEVPKVGSFVLIGLIGNDKSTAFVVKTSEVDVTLINGGENGGIPKAGSTQQKLNALENSLNELKTLIASWTPAPGDGGTALKGLLTSWAGTQIQVTQKSDLEDTKIKH